MRNLTLYSTVLLVSGILIAYGNIFNLSLILAVLPIILLLVYYVVKNEKMVIYLILLLSFFIFGILTYNQSSTNLLENEFGTEVGIIGKVIKIDKFDDNEKFMKLLLKSDIQIEDEIYTCNIIAYVIKNTEIKIGMFVDGSGTLLEPSKAGNRYEFDYKRYLNNNNIKAICFLKDDYRIITNISLIDEIRNNFVDYLVLTIDNQLDVKEAGLLKGIVLGESEFINENLLKDIRSLGIAHILAVSGLHIGIIISFFGFIFRLLKFKRNTSLIISIIITWIYAFFIGFPVSVLRALIMFSFMTLGLVSHRKYNLLYSIVLAVNLMLLFKPLWLFDISFQLSFTAILSIALFIKITDKYKGNKYIKSIGFLFFIQILTLPLTIYYFNSIPIFGIFINLFFVPVISIALIMTIISLVINLIVPGIANLIFILINNLLKFFIYCSEKLIDLNFGGVNFYSPNLNEIILCFLIIALVIYFIVNKTERYRFHKLYFIIFSSIALYILMFVFIPSLNNNMKISVINVGQGSASLIQYDNNNLMIDIGGEVSLKYELADVLLPSYLIKRGVNDLDVVFISHYHSDHYSGLDKVNEKIKIKSVISYNYNSDVLKDINGIDFYKMNEGSNIKINDNFTIDVIWPPDGILSKDENQNSMVLLLNYYRFKILFTGDIDKLIESKIINKLNDIDVLVVPHHGSDTSSSENFINKLNPKYAIMSYGENNYGIPSPNVIESYNDNGIQLLSTFNQGEINIEILKNSSFKINSFYNKEKFDYYLVFLLSLICTLYVWVINLFKGSYKFYE